MSAVMLEVVPATVCSVLIAPPAPGILDATDPIFPIAVVAEPANPEIAPDALDIALLTPAVNPFNPLLSPPLNRLIFASKFNLDIASPTPDGISCDDCIVEAICDALLATKDANGLIDNAILSKIPSHILYLFLKKCAII